MPMLGLGTAARLARELRRDVKVIHERDPAARGVTSVEILATWPGVHALLTHRVAHTLHEAGIPLVPRVLSGAARTLTGIEIHPGARIGDGFFIDHGAGVGVGETAEFGDDVTLYQGVTLGGTGFATGKRPPTVLALVPQPGGERPRRDARAPGEELASVDRERADLVLAVVHRKQRARVDVRLQVGGEAQDAVEAQDVRDEVVGEDRQPVEAGQV